MSTHATEPAHDPALGSHSSATQTYPRIVARTIKIPARDESLDALVRLLPHQAPLAWVRRGEGIVGWGEIARFDTSGASRFTDAMQAWNTIREHAIVRDEVSVPGSGPVAFGSFAFAQESAASSVLIVPQFVVGRRADAWWFTVMTTVEEPFATTPTLDELVAQHQPITSPGQVDFETGALTGEQWQEVVADAVHRIRNDELEKIVLARDVIGTSEQPIDVRHVLSNLVDSYENCWTFSVDGMIGATPELLVRTEKGLVTSRVLAGTIQRTGDDETDTARAAVLAHSSKDLEEHEYAVRSVADALRPYCSSLNVPETPFVLHLPNVLHLASDVAAVVDTHAGATSLSLAAALHPTAAVCGTPTDLAAQLILDIENMDRSRYAGPVGWVGADGDGEWGIALRSAELCQDNPNTIRLFAGCGIVAASNPADELAETFAKLRPMTSAVQA
ncbi:isochorismate synthase [Timonella sp. A28]|uniref:isochorismate synthase n=1 Tax=Timonella sp. A28 TaxID=3442640 RepID=UPI003EBB681F